MGIRVKSRVARQVCLCHKLLVSPYTGLSMATPCNTVNCQDPRTGPEESEGGGKREGRVLHQRVRVRLRLALTCRPAPAPPR